MAPQIGGTPSLGATYTSKTQGSQAAAGTEGQQPAGPQMSADHAKVLQDVFQDGKVSSPKEKEALIKDFAKVFDNPVNRQLKEFGLGVSDATYENRKQTYMKKLQDFLDQNPNATPQDVEKEISKLLSGAAMVMENVDRMGTRQLLAKSEEAMNAARDKKTETYQKL